MLTNHETLPSPLQWSKVSLEFREKNGSVFGNLPEKMKPDWLDFRMTTNKSCLVLQDGMKMKSETFLQSLLFPFLKKNFDISQENIVYSHQSHSTKIKFITQGTIDTATDGWITNVPKLTLVVHSADCVPILIWDTQNKTIALIHAGWKGTSNKIVQTALRMMFERGTNPKNVFFHLGPAIGDCCYEVGSDVASQFENPIQKKDAYFLNLITENQNQALHLSVPKEQIFSTDLCTACHPSLFYSYRREKALSGQMFSMATIKI